MSPVTTIRNLGPAMERAFARAGITSAEALREMGCDAAYLAAMRSGMAAHFAGYMALCLGLQGRPWTDAAGPEKAAMRQRYDALREQAKAGRETPGSELQQFLDRIGLPGPL
ncbi:TfoX C-terminal domain-containing protein [Pseudooceanicola antarcticus]|uniref:Competence protein TfoX n=1 Tax=Pseudooceanicola antarcticus TaxID=1247613 RepID=A0A285IZ34_9RHOB|nr:TfoX/Sxy family DNA transformation protein [Pseudooceanicola antarcticus]PJE25691.1 competence protein TfoX [Pseudooceanicola antarcticus]SNY53242.1 TfoX C-terminal domain-containing protein [Pseudooceanicola antarcticus]